MRRHEAKDKAVNFLMQNRAFFLAPFENQANFVNWINTLKDEKEIIQVSVLLQDALRRKIPPKNKLINREGFFFLALDSGKREEIDNLLKKGFFDKLIRALNQIEFRHKSLIAHWYAYTYMQEVKQVTAAVHNYNNNINQIVAHILNMMQEAPHDIPQHVISLGIIKDVLNKPSPANLLRCSNYAKTIKKNTHVKKILGGLMLCLVGSLAVTAAVLLTGATTALTLGLSTPLSLIGGISIAVAGVALINAGIGLIYLGRQEKRLSIAASFKGLFYEGKKIFINQSLELDKIAPSSHTNTFEESGYSNEEFGQQPNSAKSREEESDDDDNSYEGPKASQSRGL